MSRKKTTKEFIRQAKAKPGRKYDYSETIYTGCFDEIKIYLSQAWGEKASCIVPSIWERLHFFIYISFCIRVIEKTA